MFYMTLAFILTKKDIALYLYATVCNIIISLLPLWIAWKSVSGPLTILLEPKEGRAPFLACTS